MATVTINDNIRSVISLSFVIFVVQFTIQGQASNLFISRLRVLTFVTQIIGWIVCVAGARRGRGIEEIRRKLERKGSAQEEGGAEWRSLFRLRALRESPFLSPSNTCHAGYRLEDHVSYLTMLLLYWHPCDLPI